MFHFKDEFNASIDDHKKLIKKAFQDSLSTTNDHLLLKKTDFKVAWLYLFGYKISKVSSFFTFNFIY